MVKHPFLEMNHVYEITFIDGSKSIVYLISYIQKNYQLFQLKFLGLEGISQFHLMPQDFTEKKLLCAANPFCWRKL